MAASHFEDVLALGRFDNVHDSGGVLFLIKAFQDHIAGLWPLVLDKVEVFAVGFDHQRVRRFADLALEGLPEIRDVVVAILLILLRLQPLH